MILGHKVSGVTGVYDRYQRDHKKQKWLIMSIREEARKSYHSVIKQRELAGSSGEWIQDLPLGFIEDWFGTSQTWTKTIV